MIKNKETKTENTSMSISVTVDDEINLNKFKRKRSDQGYLKDMNIKIDTRRKCVNLMFTDIVSFVKS